jgi:hypothetical protein
MPPKKKINIHRRETQPPMPKIITDHHAKTLICRTCKQRHAKGNTKKCKNQPGK